MALNFEIIGKIKPIKETESFKAYEERDTKSGNGKNISFNFNVVSGDNLFSQQLRYYRSTIPSDIYCIGNSSTVNGKKQKGEKFIVKYEDRMKKENIDKVANWMKYIFDYRSEKEKNEASRLSAIISRGESISVDDKEKYGVSTALELKNVVEKINSKRKEFIYLGDFVTFIDKIMKNKNYSDKTYDIRGEIIGQYSQSNDKWYYRYVPRRIYLANDDAEDMAEANSVFYFNKDSLDKMSADDKKEVYVNAFYLQYDEFSKSEIAVPYVITVPCAKDDSEQEQRRERIQTARFSIDDGTWKEYGCQLKLLNGSQGAKLKFDDLTEEQQDSIMLGELTLEDIQREVGVVYGEKITRQIFLKPIRGYSKGPVETAYDNSKFYPSFEEDEVVSTYTVDDDDIDLFDDDDIL